MNDKVQRTVEHRSSILNFSLVPNCSYNLQHKSGKSFSSATVYTQTTEPRFSEQPG